MKTDSTDNNKGSVLIIALLTITVMTLICATSLLISSQNTSTGVQTSAWQQALTGAETGIDAAIRALNQNGVSSANPWTNWKTVSTATLPTIEPASGTGSNAAAAPTSSQYNYLPSSQLSISYPHNEGTTSISAWVTIDTAGGLSSSFGSWYRIRATGQAMFKSNSVLKRVSNNRMDNDLRNTITMNFNRKGGSTLGPTRTIEVVVQPIPKAAIGMTLANWLTMSGAGTIDSFSSPTGQWSSAFRDSNNPLVVAEGNTSNQAKFANTNQTYVYGGVVYSGTAPTNINAAGPPPDVLGQVSTPDNITVQTTTDPAAVTGQSGAYTWAYYDPWTTTTTNYTWNSSTTYTGGGGLPNNNTVTSITATGTSASPSLIIINGDFNASGSQIFTINPTTTGNPAVADPTHSYVTIWVKGKFTTSGQSLISQLSGTTVRWIVDGDINLSGQSYNNQNGTAATDCFVGIGNHNFNSSGSSNLTATVNAPGYTGSISGGGDFTGAFVGSTMDMSGGSNFHYDEALTTSNTGIGNYAFVSWFEDNSDPTRKVRDVNNALQTIVY